MIEHMDGVALTGTLGGGAPGLAVDAAAPPVGWASGPLCAVQAADREIARQTALRARAIAEFAATRPASADRAQGEPGAMSAERWAARSEVLRAVSEWAAPELSIALNLSAPKAEAELERSLVLVHRLPRVLAALEAAVLHTGHLWCLLEHVAPIADDALRTRIQEELIDWVGTRHRVTTPAQLGDRVRRVVAKYDARDAARDLARALRQRGISLRPERTAGMVALTVVCTMPEAQALYRALGACADALAADERTRGQKMVDCLLDLVLRPGEGELPPVQVLLTVVASMGTLLGGDAPGEIDGHVVPAELVRQLLHGLTGHQASAAAESDDRPWEAIEQDELANWWAEMERRVLAGELDGEAEPAPDSRHTDPPAPDGWPPAEPAGRDRDLGLDPDPGLDLDLDPDRGLGALTDPDPPADRDQPPPHSGWWSAADRAVDDASSAVHAAARALGQAHRMLRTARAADVADETAWRVGPGGRVTAAPDALTALTAAGAAQREELADLLAATAGGGLADRPRIALTDALSGALVALTDLPGLRRAAHCGAPTCRRRPRSCSHDLTGRPGLGAPATTDAYRPDAGLDRFVRARDRRCRFPGCRRRVPRAGELDHDRPWPDGSTSASNLVGYCTTDHRGKHQAPGWRRRVDADGTLTVTTPTGLTATSTPPPY
jgi:hypothetical protein